MNKLRRTNLEKVIRSIEDAMSELECLKEEEEEYRDNMPENLQGSERYERADEACDNLYSAVSSLEEAISYIDYAINV